MFFKEIFKDLQNSKHSDPHPMWDLFKRDQFKLSDDLVDLLAVTEAQKHKLKELASTTEELANDTEQLLEVLDKDENLFDNLFWLNFFLGIRDQGCQEISPSEDVPVPISCSGVIRNMTWSQINTVVTKDYGDILSDQIAIPEIKVEVEDKKELAKSIKMDFENRAKGKSTEEREKIKEGMKTTIKAKHLHEIRARDAEVKIIDDILQYFKVSFVICSFFKQYLIENINMF